MVMNPARRAEIEHLRARERENWVKQGATVDFLAEFDERTNRMLGEGAQAPDLPPDPEGMNDDRAAWAGEALARFQAITGSDDCDALPDLLIDLMHFADRNREEFGTFDEALEWARQMYAEETLPFEEG